MVFKYSKCKGMAQIFLDGIPTLLVTPMSRSIEKIIMFELSQNLGPSLEYDVIFNRPFNINSHFKNLLPSINEWQA